MHSRKPESPQHLDEAARLRADYNRRQAQNRPIPYSVAQAFRRVLEARNSDGP